MTVSTSSVLPDDAAPDTDKVPTDKTAQDSVAEQLETRRRRARAAEREARQGTGKVWGASTRRGPVDKRTGIKEKPKPLDANFKLDFGGNGEGEERWYCVAVTPGREKTAQDFLQLLDGWIGETGTRFKLETWVPEKMEEGVNPRTQRRTMLKVKVLPAYVLVKCKLDNELHALISSRSHVKGFLGAIDRFGPRVDNIVHLPLPMGEEEIANILAETEDAPTDAVQQQRKELADFKVQQGQVIQVTAGPFKGFSGQVVQVDPKHNKVKAMLVIFGRDTPTELDASQVTNGLGN
ncbi:hypothetical protein CYMTET_18734 [Cymbomonas tetramitiformis]|uniref:Transcription termination/antitermination protein NusG n=1 Tax=Cymbomonas tetramitiformis TaxID=36881 RepID=A0AAE0G8S7_9CHLO|nr:hypothetical protein CYMTET_18734 [Cymbomonas tetramitiformis]|eukprot:gene1496-2124_t